MLLRVAFIGILLTASALAQSSTPQGALEEMALADNPDDVLRHLPLTVNAAIEKLKPAAKKGTLDHLLTTNNLAREGLKLRRSANGTAWEVVKIETNEVERTLEITDTFITGDRAMLTVRTGQGSSPYTEDLFVFMRFEEGEWRLDEFGRAERHSLQQLISERFVPSWSTEAGAQATVQQLIFALATYAQTFPAIGFPYQLDALACVEPTISQDVEPASHNTQAATDAVSNDITSENATDEEAAPPSQSEASPDHACLLPPHFVSTRLQNSGYQLQYTPIDRTAYQIVATPIRYGDTGMKSFFADQTGVIHFTTDDRPATAQDEVAPTSRRALID